MKFWALLAVLLFLYDCVALFYAGPPGVAFMTLIGLAIMLGAAGDKPML